MKGVSMSKSSAPKPVEELTYEEAFAELESIVSSLENSKNPLEESLSLFERGQALVRRCSALLEHAELIVRKLSEGELVDFEAED